MTSEHQNTTAPWAKALDAVLLATLVLIATFYAIGTYRAKERKEAAVKGTREEAQRFVDDVLHRNEGFPTSRQQMDEVYATSVHRAGAWLYYL